MPSRRSTQNPHERAASARRRGARHALARGDGGRLRHHGRELTPDTALALWGNTAATGAMLVVLILVFGPVSGAHFNPAVTLVMALRGDITALTAIGFVLAQCAGGVAGTVLAHAMFEQPLLQLSSHPRTGLAQWLSEGVATFALLAAILGTLRWKPDAVPYAVGLVIIAGYWWTASTSFANPAVALARALTDTFSGIRPADLPAFVLAQLAGALIAVAVFGWLLQKPRGN